MGVWVHKKRFSLWRNQKMCLSLLGWMCLAICLLFLVHVKYSSHSPVTYSPSKPLYLLHREQWRHVDLSSFWELGILQIPSALLLPFLFHYPQGKRKVYDTSNTHPQPWPSSTLPQSSVTSLIIRLSSLCLLVRLSNRCPSPNLPGNLVDALVQIRVSFQLYSFMLLFFWHPTFGSIALWFCFGFLSAVITVQKKKATFNGIMRKTCRSEHSRTHDARSGGGRGGSRAVALKNGGVAQADKKNKDKILNP